MYRGGPSMDNETLSHSTWNCKYHIVFSPKYRRQIIYSKLRTEIGKILRTLCERREIEIFEAELCPDHIHMLVSIQPKYSVASVMGYMKGKSTLMIFDKFAHMKYKYGNRKFWCRGILCRYSRKEREENSGIHKDAAARRLSGRPAKFV
jgi:putative transposase